MAWRPVPARRGGGPRSPLGAAPRAARPVPADGVGDLADGAGAFVQALGAALRVARCECHAPFADDRLGFHAVERRAVREPHGSRAGRIAFAVTYSADDSRMCQFDAKGTSAKPDPARRCSLNAKPQAEAPPAGEGA